MRCPDCGEEARFVGWRGSVLISLLGAMQVSMAYYHCQRCGKGIKPNEEQWCLEEGRLTRGAEEVVTLVGLVGSFGQAAEELLPKLTGLRLSASTVERTTEKAGERVVEEVETGEGLGPQADWEWQKDAMGQTCAYVGVDATGVPQQGPGGVHAEGKMAYVGMVYNPGEKGGKKGKGGGEVRYLAGFYDLTTLGRRLQDEALRVGLAKAQQQIAISDGGAGLEELFRTYFPKAEVILDFWHAKEHLVELGQSLFGEDEEKRKGWTEDACGRLKELGGRSVREWLEGLDLSAATAGQKEEHRRQVQYFRNHEHKMDYPRYIRNGWQIGSGPVESACKTVVGNRLKGGGMRWGKPGAHAVCQLRALFLSEPVCWKSFWKPPSRCTPPPLKLPYLQK